MSDANNCRAKGSACCDRSIARNRPDGTDLRPWLPGQGPNQPGEVVFVRKEPTDASGFIGVPHTSGVGRINESGELEYTADGVDEIRTWVPTPAIEFGSFLCD